MKICLIVGSHRKESQSLKVARYYEHQFKEIHPSIQLDLLDMGTYPLPLWEEGIWHSEPKITNTWKPISQKLHSADGFVVISPEWAGMVPSGLKNLFLFCNGGELAHKPALLTGVSAARGGAYPIAELRMSSYKNTFLCYLPEHIIVRDVAKMLNLNEAPTEKDDIYLRSRIKMSSQLLIAYAEALAQVREKKVHSLKDFPNGM